MLDSNQTSHISREPVADFKSVWNQVETVTGYRDRNLDRHLESKPPLHPSPRPSSGPHRLRFPRPQDLVPMGLLNTSGGNTQTLDRPRQGRNSHPRPPDLPCKRTTWLPRPARTKGFHPGLPKPQPSHHR
ncbi:hypothetical protein DY000_02053030 [Brassica cretica]|uniref:Uncharacterized protein n=1 Tax=Brassica cretica TaxID=69181 RepID=A0ABQ7AAY1_BRACR|nr:hypothetical protein DY000_02053030 [Brassica cretica]